MYKHKSNANIHLFSHTILFLQHQFWPLFIPLIAVFFLVFCPHLTNSLQINANEFHRSNENSDRTIDKFDFIDTQSTSTSSSVYVSPALTTTTTTAATTTTTSAEAFDDDFK
jgi:hypothetical protein